MTLARCFKGLLLLFFFFFLEKYQSPLLWLLFVSRSRSCSLLSQSLGICSLSPACSAPATPSMPARPSGPGSDDTSSGSSLRPHPEYSPSSVRSV